MVLLDVGRCPVLKTWLCNILVQSVLETWPWLQVNQIIAF
jgi:hypothetical protein